MGTRALAYLVFAFLLLLKGKSAFEILTDCPDCWCVDTYNREIYYYTTLCFHKENHPEPETISDESIQEYYNYYKEKHKYDNNHDDDDHHEFNAIPNLLLRRSSNYEMILISCSHMSSADMSTLNTTSTLNNLIPKLGIENVSHLVLEDCPIPDGSFQTLFRLLNVTSVKELRVTGSQSNITLSSAYFENLSLQTILFEDSVGLRRLHQDLFKGTPELVFLGLNRNNITTLDPGVFQGLRNLEFLYLNHNSITDLHADIFEHLTSLLDLEIINNRLVSLPRGLFRNCRKLERLDLHENALHTLEGPQFEFLSRLTLLDLRYNRLEKITDGMFNGTHGLLDLHLSHNRINAISKPAFDILCNNNHLDRIDLSNNDLEWNSDLVVSPFNSCKNIVSLKLSNNRIRCIDWIMGMPWLETLDLKWNNITILPDFNSFTSQSWTLDVSYNQIKTVKIDSIPNADDDELDLSLNAIKDRKVDIDQQFPHWKSLNLSHNNLESLSEDFINSLSKSNIRSLYLSGNPWKCGRDTSTERLCKFVFDNQHRFFNDFEEITCNGSNHTFKATKPKDFCATINISQVSNLIPVQKDSEQITLNGSNHPFNTTKPKDIYGTPKISYPTDTFDVQISLGILCVLFVLSIVFYYNKYQQKIKVWFVYRLMFCKPGVSQ
uniref:Leucine-rich repeats and immunoglobulin-like domains protein 2 n=1 Tax=Cacopsylla melanoneura TaxID=428564 RepID=A0A8D8XSQ4_9HEMI